jgi:hypothetical protein
MSEVENFDRYFVRETCVNAKFLFLARDNLTCAGQPAFAHLG